MKTHYTNTTPDSKMIGDTKAWGKTEKRQERKRLTQALRSGNPARRAEAEKALGKKK